MFRNVANIFREKRKIIEEEFRVKTKINEVLTKFIEEEVLKRSDIKYKLSHTINKGVVKIEIDSKPIAQELVLKMRTLEERLKSSGVSFKKLLI